MINQQKNNYKNRVLSGIRATGRLHLGNYLGAVKGMIELQDDPDYETFYMVADAHAITTPFDVEELRRNRRAVILDYLAAGLDPEQSVIFQQANVPQHFELAFYFSAVTTVAKMQHLPTFKEKVKQHPENVTMALLNYPVLMAADILVYMASAVPVGIDQEPHLEVAREIARRMNQDFGLDFPEPQSFATSCKYVPSLTGSGKMSKSVEGSFITLMDDEATIVERLAGVPTDSGKGTTVPEEGGVANLLTLVELFEGADQRAEYEAAYTGEGKGLRYNDLKKQLATAIATELAPIQDKRRQLEQDVATVDDIIAAGSAKAQTVATTTIQKVKTAIGLA